MRLDEVIDTTFDFRSDTPPGKDPDTWSPTLRRYHQLLWSKPLPNGELFELDVTPRPPYYLHHLSELGEFWLSSDAVIPTFSRARETQHIIGQVPVAETAEFNRIAYTIGGMMVFPANQIDRFFRLFGDFAGYVDFFLLQDLVDALDLTVKFSIPFEDFTTSPLPQTRDEYTAYRERTVEFIESRNQRIAARVGVERL